MFDRRIEQAVDTTSSFNMADAAIERYVYGGDNVVLDFLDPDGDGTGTAQALKTRSLFGPNVDQILAQEDAGTNAVLWHLGDHLGTVRDLIESDGDLADHVAYDSFGRATSESEPSTDRLFGFNGRAFDSETGLQNNWHRWYDAATGQWASEDPIGFGARDSNLVRYVNNNSVALTDPVGLWPTVEDGPGRPDPRPRPHPRPTPRPTNPPPHDESFSPVGAFFGTLWLELASAGQMLTSPLRACGVDFSAQDQVLTDSSRVALASNDDLARGLLELDGPLISGLIVGGILDPTAGGAAAGAGTGGVAAGASGAGAVAGQTALSFSAQQLILRYGTRNAAMAALAQMQSILDSLPVGSDAWLRALRAIEYMEAAINQAFPL